jgi:hypothetical protein
MVSGYKKRKTKYIKEYDPHFVSKILKGDKDKEAGKGIKVDVDNLWNY